MLIQYIYIYSNHNSVPYKLMEFTLTIEEIILFLFLPHRVG